MTKRIGRKSSGKTQDARKPNRLSPPDKAGPQVRKLNRNQDEAKHVIQRDTEVLIYARAIALFDAGRFQAAKEAFAELAAARNRDLAHSAALRIRMCEKRLGLT
jgi:TolA-binding protein